MKSYFPSLYLNIGNSFEKLNDIERAKEYYELAVGYLQYLQDDGYGQMIRKGIEAAGKRVSI